jgi:23S rRNA pseudouridine1911/1915/1917 synthase
MQDQGLDDDFSLESEFEEGYEIVKKVVLDYVCDPGQEPTRIDKFIQVRVQSATRSKVQEAIEEGMVTVNGGVIKNNYKVKPGDHIIAHQYKVEGSDIVVPENIPLNIVFEDDDVLLLHKPFGMVVHPGSGNHNGTLVNGVAYYLQQQGGNLDELPRVGLVHRIDKDTSGLILFAKTAKAMVNLAAQFKAHTVQREYVALVWGDVEENEGTVTGHIARHERNRMQFDVYEDASKGKHAITHYKVLERFGYVTLIACKLETGRTHQIRVHMKYLGHILFNDYRYGGDRILKGTVYSKYKQFIENCFDIIPRQALHAKTLGFKHPITDADMFFDSEYPDDLQKVLVKWRTYATARPESD